MQFSKLVVKLLFSMLIGAIVAIALNGIARPVQMIPVLPMDPIGLWVAPDSSVEPFGS